MYNHSGDEIVEWIWNFLDCAKAKMLPGVRYVHIWMSELLTNLVDAIWVDIFGTNTKKM